MAAVETVVMFDRKEIQDLLGEKARSLVKGDTTGSHCVEFEYSEDKSLEGATVTFKGQVK